MTVASEVKTPSLENSDASSEVTKERTIIVLDTSVLLSDPESIFAFEGCDIVLPLKVIEELDNHKGRPDDVGRAARQTARMLEKLRLESPDQGLRAPTELINGGTLRIEHNGLQLDMIRQHGLDTDKADNRILAAALGLVKNNPGSRVKVVSADVNLRLKAASLELEAAEYIQTHGRVHDERHPGWYQLDVDQEIIDLLYSSRWLPFELLDDRQAAQLSSLKANEYGVLKSTSSAKSSALVRKTTKDDGDGVELLDRNRRNEAWGLRARSKEQAFALDLLLDPEIPIVGLSGRAGTGKTILALASALAQTFERKENNVYDRVMILRPVVPVGNQDVGFLPGTLEEKLGPWMEPITDAMVALGDDITHLQAKSTLDGWINDGALTLESVTYLRGRSLQKTFVIVDEAQNLEPLTLKTILTRIGMGSKVVLVGDVSQIDNPWSSERSNAISVLADRFTGRKLFGHLVLSKGERSPVADLAADLL